MFFKTINFRLSALFCCVTVVMAALASMAYYTHQREILLDSFQAKVEGFARNLAVNSAPLLLSGDEMQLSVLISTEIKRPEVLSAGILDHGGNVILHSDINRIGRYFPEEEDAAGQGTDLRGDELTTEEPIMINGKRIGSVVMVTNMSPLFRSIGGLRYMLLTAVSIFTVISCALAVYVIGYFLKPLNVLSGAALEVGGGNFSVHVKQVGGEEIQRLASTFNEMIRKLADANHRIEEGYLQSVMALSAAVEAKDSYTRGHCDRVAYYAEQIAGKMAFDEASIKTTQLAARLHDVGKIGVDGKVLGKAGPLTEREFAHIARHPMIAWNILEPASFLAEVRDVVVMHHERFDGKGYPKGLSGEQISLPGRVLALADCYDAMTTNRPYRDHLSEEKALGIIRQESGKQFDPAVVEAFFASYDHFVSRTALDQRLEESASKHRWERDNPILADVFLPPSTSRGKGCVA